MTEKWAEVKHKPSFLSKFLWTQQHCSSRITSTSTRSCWRDVSSVLWLWLHLNLDNFILYIRAECSYLGCVSRLVPSGLHLAVESHIHQIQTQNSRSSTNPSRFFGICCQQSRFPWAHHILTSLWLATGLYLKWNIPLHPGCGTVII